MRTPNLSRALFFPESRNAPGELRQDTSEFNVIFVHSRLDDYGLPAPVFRVYCHLARRAGSGAAFPAIASIARICRLHPQTVRQALRVLVQHRLITRELRQGRTPLYRITPATQWQPPKNICGNPSETDTPPSVSQERPSKLMKGHPSETNTAEGNPGEDIPNKELQSTPPPPEGVSVTVKSSSLSQAEAIYEAYPRKAGKPAALRAIHQALLKYPFEHVLERTRLFAKTYKGEPRFIPYPAKWFAEERFNDETANWSMASGGNPQPTIVRQDNFGQGSSKL